MLQGIGTSELLIISALLMLMFGGSRLPKFARGVGDAVKEFRNAAKEITA